LVKGEIKKIRVIKEILNIFEEYRPELGKVYDAEYSNPRRNKTEFCIVDILDKRIVLRRGEFEIIGV
jgi:hypothetical protein